MLKYKWNITPKTTQLLIELEAVRLLFDRRQIEPQVETNLRRTAILKSAVFSARIEGFTDTVNLPKKESQNLLTAYHFIYSPKAPKKLTLTLIRRLHQQVLKDISGSAGQWRQETWAIFTTAGAVVHQPPPHIEVPQLMAQFIDFINRLTGHPGVKAAIAQFVFEKIHPFADGNGRVGRLISALILEKSGFGFRGLAPFEEYIDQHRDSYYVHLEPSKTCTGFIEYFLEGVVSQSQKIIETIDLKTSNLPEGSLLPRRREILEIIRDHPNCSFDFLHRRFAAISTRTLHHDLAHLRQKGFVKKLGVTNGVVYKA